MKWQQWERVCMGVEGVWCVGAGWVKGRWVGEGEG